MKKDKQLQINLSKEDFTQLEKIAQKLGITPLDVIRKGIRIMSIYAQTNPIQSKSVLILKVGQNRREIIIM